ncbi:MAG TPA: M1 family aminopeptidase [Rubricoccaceae bacterium]|jgi:aminopeptidase N
MRRLAMIVALAVSPSASSGVAAAQPLPAGQTYAPGVDVQRYAFDVTLSDATDAVRAEALIVFRVASDTTTVLPLDLVSARPDTTGMAVSGVTLDGAPARFTHTADRLTVRLGPTVRGAEHTAVVTYAGVPADGLVIGVNRHGERTFFGDHWPNRARNWLPVVDHPSDKALVDWAVTAPAAYQVVANGRLAEETDGPDGTRVTRWEGDRPIATKIAVIGVARFAVDHRRPVVAAGVPVDVQTWAYPDDRAAGFADFARADSALVVLADLLGPFPYAKLANVESTTRFGGMENAGAIFYDEGAVTGTGANAATVVHEVAHQWFGDLVSEADWPHLWLSEGFATYLTHVYAERTRGAAALRAGLARDRTRIVAFAATNPQRMLVDTTFADPMELLNAYSYQRGSWTLHLLRRRVGDDAFFAGLRLYLALHADGNAVTADLQAALEETSGERLGGFFQTWTRRPGLPRIDATWRASGAETVVTLRQAGVPYAFPLTVEATAADGRMARVTADVAGNETLIRFPFAATAVALDPDVDALADLHLAAE